jgi:hypothetical protein
MIFNRSLLDCLFLSNLIDPLKMIFDFFEPPKAISDFFEPSKTISDFFEPSKTITNFINSSQTIPKIFNSPKTPATAFHQQQAPFMQKRFKSFNPNHQNFHKSSLQTTLHCSDCSVIEKLDPRQ